MPLDSAFNNKFRRGCKFGKYGEKYNEIVINNKVLRIRLQKILKVDTIKCNSSINELVTPSKRKSILKNNKDIIETPKCVKFDDIVTITPISPRKICESSSEEESTVTPDIYGIFYDTHTPVVRSNLKVQKHLFEPNFVNGELTISVLQSNTKLNSSYITQSNKAIMTTEENVKPNDDDKKENVENKLIEAKSETDTKNDNSEVQVIKIEVISENDEPINQIEYLKFEEIPKRKRGRPRKNNSDPDPPFSPFTTPKKKPYVTPKKPYITPKKPAFTDPNEPKRKRGRPRKKLEFGFHSIVSDINSITLPSDLWSAHVSVTSKRSQVCFTRIVQAVSDSVPVECDRSVKFIGGKNFYIKMNNRLVELVGAPKTVESLKDVEVLLEIVNELNINDPVLRYYVR